MKGSCFWIRWEILCSWHSHLTWCHPKERLAEMNKSWCDRITSPHRRTAIDLVFVMVTVDVVVSWPLTSPKRSPTWAAWLSTVWTHGHRRYFLFIFSHISPVAHTYHFRASVSCAKGGEELYQMVFSLSPSASRVCVSSCYRHFGWLRFVMKLWWLTARWRHAAAQSRPTEVQGWNICFCLKWVSRLLLGRTTL